MVVGDKPKFEAKRMESKTASKHIEAVFEDVHPIGFEPMTYGLENRCSIQLSYGCVFPC